MSRPLAMLRNLALAAVALGAAAPAVIPAVPPQQHARQHLEAELRQRFEQATLMLHARRHADAAAALQRVLELSPRMPEAHVNLGFALLGLQQADQARLHFERAIDLRTRQANAYYGLAMALEQQGDLPGALGAMRSYLHLSPPDERFQAKARAALWEWEQRLRPPGPRPPLPAPAPGRG